MTTLAALEQSLRRGGKSVPQGGGVDAALDVYAGHGAEPDPEFDAEPDAELGAQLDAELGDGVRA
ncbi:hypothetical protein [Curtobacterium sp. MCPF17_052]|uniref:hypothetical protein n=1 Tax=Curtobacterium sp. MCPF17_052 TaxID=2175655 RepID=UPI0024DF5E0C|nr:hypothetical protein [Curtobacterium sp. MCPF17_052]WIB13178.1 hypothetical protein DEJ36_04605 [Curtobacterium sp. MCPF17_052]